MLKWRRAEVERHGVRVVYMLIKVVYSSANDMYADNKNVASVAGQTTFNSSSGGMFFRTLLRKLMSLRL